jgi:hypothetical protein
LSIWKKSPASVIMVLAVEKFSVTSAALNLGKTSASFDSFAFSFYRWLLIGSPELQFLEQSAFGEFVLQDF